MSKILIADDDMDILTVVKLILSMNHYYVHTVSDWREIPGEIERFSPDLLLLDVWLGGADGRDICKNLKESERTQDLPIVLFSANTDFKNDIRGCNADGFISKPFETTHLIKTIHCLLK
ncbi:MAG: response regulator [Ginsengibacter sp.]